MIRSVDVPLRVGGRLRRAALVLILGAAAGCGGATPGEAVRPAEGTAKELLDREPAGVCHPVNDFGEPLVVDWEAHQRADMEEAMHDGVAVVAYDCKSLRLLKGCSVDGSYGFVGVSKKEEVVQLENADELRANLPAFGTHFAKEFGAEMDRGSTVDVAMILVGKKRTTVQHAAREALRGGAACEGATHFLRGAFVGAFALALGTKGKVDVAASVFGGAESKSSKLEQVPRRAARHLQAGRGRGRRRALDVQRAREARARGAGRAAEAGRATPSSEESACPAGLVRRAGKCTQAVRRQGARLQVRRHQRLHRSSARRATPRAARRSGTCTWTATACRRTTPARSPSSGSRCDGRNAAGCNNLGFLYANGRGVPKDDGRAFTLYKQSCDLGEPVGCENIAWFHGHGQGGAAKDALRAIAFHKQACDAGNAGACRRLAEVSRDGLMGVTKDAGRASGFFKQSCDGGNNDERPRFLNDLQLRPGRAGRSGPGRAALPAGLRRRQPDGLQGPRRSLPRGQGRAAGTRARATALFKQGLRRGATPGPARASGTWRRAARAGPGTCTAPSPSTGRACDGHLAHGLRRAGLDGRERPGHREGSGPGPALLEQGCSGGNFAACVDARRPLRPAPRRVQGSRHRPLQAGLRRRLRGRVHQARRGRTSRAARRARRPACTGLGCLYESAAGSRRTWPARPPSTSRPATGTTGPAASSSGSSTRTAPGSRRTCAAPSRSTSRPATPTRRAAATTSGGSSTGTGTAWARTTARAALLFKQACDGSNANGCSNLGIRVRVRRGVPADRASAVRLYRQGCKGGNPWGCDQLRRLGEPQ